MDQVETVADESRSARIGVVSGRYPPSEFDSHVNHKAYCARHGYTYIHCNWPTGQRNPYLNKLEYVQAYCHLFDFVFWIDDDAFFMDLEQPLEQFLPEPGQYLSICSSPTGKRTHTYVSSGQFMLTCDETGVAFLKRVREVDLQEVRAWWSPELGYFTNGDQDSMVYLMKTERRFSAYRRHDYQAFNSRIDDLLAGAPVFVLHFTGPVAVKRRNYRRAQRFLGRGPTLLPPEESRRWQLVSRRRLLVRKVRGVVQGFLRWP